MEVDEKVFSSNITRKSQEEKNNLYDLLQIDPAAPIRLCTQNDGCEFQPRSDKNYEPKKRSKLKVKTVRDIRNVFEKDVYSYLLSDLEKQQNILLKKIIDGSSKSENTQKLASTILECDNPISRSGWQMLMNINPDKNIHPVQYVFWNGKRIRICGSRGGKNKFIFQVDLGKRKDVFNYRKSLKRTKKGLLQNSLSVKFKPGPLQLKKYLDDSYQKYHVGNIELIDLPKPGLEIQTIHGCSLDPTIINFLNSLRDIDGTISQEWADFAVSVVRNVTGSYEVQLDKESNVTFDLSYKYGQSRILVRRDIDKAINLNIHNLAITERLYAHHEADVMPEIKNIICDMMDCVEISLKQDNMYSGIDDERDVATIFDSSMSNHLFKEKPKKKYSELDRLHVTVIRLAENSENPNTEKKVCNNAHCLLGCVCISLECPIHLRRHCGRIDCMFECKCNFSKYKALDSIDGECPELLPDLYNLDNAVSSKLAKEEQKFHQTVIMTGEKSILLKSQRRNWKASKKYSDFYKNMPLKPDFKDDRVLTVVARKLNCKNIEPWCMVHNLYKCFCKGKFVDSIASSLVTHDSIINKAVDLKDKAETDIKSSDVNKTFKSRDLVNKYVELKNNDITNSDVKSNDVKKLLKLREQPERFKSRNRLQEQPDISYNRKLTKRKSNSFESDNDDSYCDDYNDCARVKPYIGRKFSNGYYINTNMKIWELEKNDRKLSKRLETLTANMDIDDVSNTSTSVTTNKNDNTSTIISNEINMDESEINEADCSNIQDSPFKTWLETAFKKYKTIRDKGGTLVLQAPQANKFALYPWDFILSRYRERKNHFLVSKHRPFRMFMAVDVKHPFFQNCINIDNIRFADLYKYPIIVKNLLTNATGLKDSFCILNGLLYCWELKGAVTKVMEPNSDNSSNGDLTENLQAESTQTAECSNDNEIKSSEAKIQENVPETVFEKNMNNSDISKWFVMTVENDITEIQLPERGFFVTYKNILHALRIARVSGKTARLSGQKNVDPDGPTPFGVYAIPNVNEDCVFIGPYESDESLGVETVPSHFIKRKRTRGFWITTNKVDDMKVIDNPMSFVPPKGSDRSDFVSLDSDYNDSKEKLVNDTRKNVAVKSPLPLTKLKNKSVKPIRIRKSNNMFRVTAESVLKSTSTLRQQRITHSKANNNLSLISNTNNLSSTLPTPGPSSLLTYVIRNDQSQTNTSETTDISIANEENVFLMSPTEVPQIKISSVASILNEDNVLLMPPPEERLEIKISSVASLSNEDNEFLISSMQEGPDIKISSVYSEADKTIDEKNENYKQGGNMFVLKPEEINKRLMVNLSSCDNDGSTNDNDNEQININETQIDTDIENFLAKSVIYPDLVSDVFVISDDDEETTDEDKWTQVWIECINIENIGWIQGRRDTECNLSFKFPGFQFSEFYPEEVAFYKINQVLSRKICMPKNITMDWKVTETISELKSSYQLKSEHFGPDFVLTKRGLRHKRDLLKSIVRNFKTYSRVPRNSIAKLNSGKSFEKMETDDTEQKETPERTDSEDQPVL